MSEPTEDLDAQTRCDIGSDQATLGTPIAVFQPGFRTRVVLAALGAVLIGCACAYMYSKVFGKKPEYMFMLGLPCLFVGLHFLFRAFLFSRRRLVICPGGVVIRILGREQVWCHWNEIREIEVKTLTGGGMLTSGSVIGVGLRNCSLVKRDGSRLDLVDYHFGPFGALVDSLRPTGSLAYPFYGTNKWGYLNVGQFGALVDTLRQVSEPYHIPWKRKSLTQVLGVLGRFG